MIISCLPPGHVSVQKDKRFRKSWLRFVKRGEKVPCRFMLQTSCALSYQASGMAFFKNGVRRCLQSCISTCMGRSHNPSLYPNPRSLNI